jgi:hypothetical protein
MSSPHEIPSTDAGTGHAHDAGVTRRTTVQVATYSRYEDAQRAVDALSDDGFPVQELSIVASDLRLVERVTGRLTVWSAAAGGAGSGALAGALIGALLGSFAFVDPLRTLWVTALYGLVVGAIIGAILGGLAHAMSRGRRDFNAVSSIAADRYDVVATPDVADEARRRLAQLGV